MEYILYRLYEVFYEPERNPSEAGRIERNHQALIGKLGKQERKLVLRIIDDKDLLIERSSYNGFACGFRLAATLMSEIKNKGGHST